MGPPQWPARWWAAAPEVRGFGSRAQGCRSPGRWAREGRDVLRQQHQLFVALLCLADGLVVTTACILAWAVRRVLIEGFAPASWENYIKEPLLLFVVPLTLLSMRWFRLYRPRRDRSSLLSEQVQVVKACVVALAATIVVLWAMGSNELMGRKGYGPAVIAGFEIDAGRLQLGTLALVLPALLGAERLTFRTALRAIRRRGWNLRHVAVVGTGRLGQIVARTLDRNTWTGIQVAYFLSHHPTTSRRECLGRPVLGGLDALERVLERHKPDAVYLAIPTSHAAHVPDVLRRLDRFAVDVRIVPDVPPRYLPQTMTISELDGMPILSYRESPVYGLGGATKRAVDVAGSLLGLLAFGPLMIAIALAIRLTSPGPVIFKQRRVSLGGQTFTIYKFRTMYHVEDEEAPPAWTARDDPRITPVGRFLRRTSLDELPQLLNVLKGQMSLVGPRPERPELIERFREDWRGYMLRQHVRAGMTGWAQVQGLRGDTSLRKRLQYDLFYIRHWSLLFDLKILWLTLFRGFVHRNAH